MPLFARLAIVAVGHPAEPALSTGERVALCGGIALCLVSLTVVHSRSPDGGVVAARLSAAAVSRS